MPYPAGTRSVCTSKDRDTDMAVSSLRYSPGKVLEESHHGTIVYDGKPRDCFDWEFRTALKNEILKTETDAGKRGWVDVGE